MIEVAQITKNPIPEADILLIFQSLCEAVSVFHKHEPPIAHRDIKVTVMLVTFLFSGQKPVQYSNNTLLTLFKPFSLKYPISIPPEKWDTDVNRVDTLVSFYTLPRKQKTCGFFYVFKG